MVTFLKTKILLNIIKALKIRRYLKIRVKEVYNAFPCLRILCIKFAKSAVKRMNLIGQRLVCALSITHLKYFLIGDSIIDSHSFILC